MQFAKKEDYTKADIKALSEEATETVEYIKCKVENDIAKLLFEQLEGTKNSTLQSEYYTKVTFKIELFSSNNIRFIH
ncbi:MAG: hypothetical protein UZ11_BCD004002032 [Bacteroidetes bacterium OLB11]|nr:MAG: hypothetical protein UZ11_BCD004002032 [Bacteroidetes bacterium OLB11]